MDATNKATLTKWRIGEILRCIEAGQPIEPEGSIWTLIDCLTVAGVLLSSAQAASGHAHSTLTGKEAVQKTLQDLQAAIEFIGAMANAYQNGTWDEYFESTVTIGYCAGGLRSLDGFKQ